MVDFKFCTDYVKLIDTDISLYFTVRIYLTLSLLEGPSAPFAPSGSAPNDTVFHILNT